MPKKTRTPSSAPKQAQAGASSTPARAGGRVPFPLADWVLWLCLFCSGMTALVYEVLWTRMITNVIGGAPFAVATVLTIFMGGMGAGSYLAGRIVDRQASPSALVRLYGLLELVIGAFALVVPLAVSVLKPAYGWI